MPSDARGPTRAVLTSGSAIRDSVLPNGSAVNGKNLRPEASALPFGSMGPEKEDVTPDEFRDRLKLALKVTGVSQNGLEDEVFPGSGYVSKLIRGGRGKRPAYETVVTIARALKIREEWLGAGDGPMLYTEEASPRDQAIDFALRLGALREAVDEAKRRFPASEHEKRSALWWMERIIDVDHEVRHDLAERKRVPRKRHTRRTDLEAAEAPIQAPKQTLIRKRA